MFVRHKWETGGIERKAARAGEWTTEGKGLEGLGKMQRTASGVKDWDLAGT